MTNADSLIRLRELHEELSTMNDDWDSTQAVDEETIDALGQLITDVNVIVDHVRGNQAATDEASHNDVLDRIARFETQHPRVSSFLSQVTDILAMMGI